MHATDGVSASSMLGVVEPRNSSSSLWIVLGVAVAGAALAALWFGVVRGRAAPPPSDASGGPATRRHRTQVQRSVFVCYRRADSADVAGRIYQELDSRFGRQRLFKDVDAIALGRDFREAIAEAVQTCAVMLAVIGPHWLTATDGDGVRRLDDERDHVRAELEAALTRGIPVIPILVQGARVPPEADLPQSLASITYRNSIEVRPDPDFHNDMDRLMRSIASYLGESPT